MRITKKSSSNSNLAQVLIKINKRQKLSPNNKDEINNNNKHFRQSFLQNNHMVNEEPIKVQLLKNNNNKKIYSTKTIDIKTLYNNQMLLNSKNIDNDDIPNFNSNKRKMPPKDTDKKKIKTATESNDYNYVNNNNPDKTNKYNGIGSKHKYSSNINSTRVI